MNAKQLIAAVSFFAAGAAFAEAPQQVVDFSNVQTTKTRAEVRAELEQAYRTGQTLASSPAMQIVEYASPSTRSRADVRAEAVQAAKSDSQRNAYIGG